jgi:rhamnosyltransferase
MPFNKLHSIGYESFKFASPHGTAKQYKKKYAIGFVLYNPTANQIDRIINFENSEYSIYIFDNSLSPQSLQFKNKHNFTYIPSELNVGLGSGISKITQKAYLDNFTNLLFFDQDTIFSHRTLDFIDEFVLYNRDVLYKYSCICFKSEKTLVTNNYKFNILEVDLIINSGSLFNLDNLFKIGWHNTNYFVDGVDYEFCLRSHLHGLKVGINLNAPDYDHVSDQPDRCINFLGRDLLVRKYSLTRINDTLSSYIRLLGYSISSGSLRYTYKLTKSLLIYIFGLFLSRLFIR